MELGLSLSLSRLGGIPGWLPSALFAPAQPGDWWDFSDNTTLSQDAEGTTPVTALGQPVGRVVGKANGVIATQTSSDLRPIWQNDANGKPGLQFDGPTSNRFLVTPSIDFSASDKILACAGVRKLSDAAAGAAFEFSVASSSQNGSFGLLAPSSPATDRFDFRSRGTTTITAAATGAPFDAPFSGVVTGLGDISGDLATLRINGVQVAQNTGDQGTGNYGNYPLYIGRRAGSSLPYNGFIHQLVVRGGALPDAAELAKLEAYVAGKTGVTL